LAKGSREFKFVSKTVPDARRLANMRVEFDPVNMPHRKLELGVAPIRTTRIGIPRPDSVWIKFIQVVFETSACKMVQLANEVPVDVIGVVFVLDKRAVYEDLPDANSPKLLDEHGQVVHKLGPPRGVPGRTCSVAALTLHQHGMPESW
jgi:hypothetical protein